MSKSPKQSPDRPHPRREPRIPLPLSRENRVIFMRRYWYSDSYGDIAALVGMTEKNISVRLVRLRKQLRDHLVKQGVLT